MSMLCFTSPASESHTAVDRQAWRQMFGGTVQDSREAIGRSVEEAARLAGMESSEWAAIEAGYVPADPVRLRSMAAALEIRFDQMAMLVYLCQGAWEV